MSLAKHILFLTPGFSSDENDFNCIPPLQEFLISFKSEYPEVKISVIAFQYPYRNKKYLWNGVEVYPLNGRNSALKKLFVWLKALRIAWKINKFYAVDVIHSLWLGECAFTGNRLSKKFRCQHICTLMGQDVKNSNRYLNQSKNNNIKIVALSQNQFDMFFNLTKKKPDEIIHWGIDDQNFEAANRDIDLLAVGSLISLKNYSLYLNAIAKVKTSYRNIKCKLVGSGPESKSLKKLADQLGINENIDFTGLLSRQEIFKLMQRSKIFVHPSSFEGSGYVFAEALVNGMNILSFNIGYAQRNPKWFIAKDEDDFVNTLEKLLSSQLDFQPTNLLNLPIQLNSMQKFME
ncbi:MAG: glycosyltransferase [bacterium]|nr:glycosyltransferase [bacterium]